MSTNKIIILTALFAATIPAANLMISNVGTHCIPNGPCLIPTWFGYEAPSGVLMMGAALVLRDMVHEAGGAKAAVLAVAIGALVSAIVAVPSIAIASVLAFLLGELADLAVYSPLRDRRLWLAVLLSGIAGAIVDSAVFLFVAFGSFDFIVGQIIGKAWVTLAALPYFIRQQNRSVKP